MTVEAHILSGGIDSTGVLYRRLAETANEIHVLHLKIDGSFGVRQTMAARAIAVWLAKNVRPFKYYEVSPPKMIGKPCGGSLFAACGYLLGEYVVRNPFIGTVVQGTNGSPADQAPDSLERNAYREGVCAAVCERFCPAPEWIYPNIETSKAEVYALMPPELRAMCWWCPKPVRQGDMIVPCGECQKCREFSAMEVV